jgi:hypothetical protein
VSIWQQIEPHIQTAIEPGYGRDRESARRDATNAIRRAFLDLERKAAERDSLRELLVAEGIENARLTVELEQARVERELMAAWQDAAATASGPEPARDAPGGAGVDAGTGEAGT